MPYNPSAVTFPGLSSLIIHCNTLLEELQRHPQLEADLDLQTISYELRASARLLLMEFCLGLRQVFRVEDTASILEILEEDWRELPEISIIIKPESERDGQNLAVDLDFYQDIDKRLSFLGIKLELVQEEAETGALVSEEELRAINLHMTVCRNDVLSHRRLHSEMDRLRRKETVLASEDQVDEQKRKRWSLF
ncbi:hypothetical protein BJ508DRAFT_331738 [Ascobolus immersus RN42]|uniref:Uncharacterized protein n=1 Tax=Ascobolus immersus RN42 TaxID=1160509 RepID=A0A3N4HS64_ASCIM|nr:hypothetical protein BJ508DRAFT_331738 [Ascobolus immersus RN42]